MVAILREADKDAGRGSRKDKISEHTIYNGRRHFGTLEPVDVKRLRGLESENAKLKRLLVERDLEYRYAQGDHTAESSELAGASRTGSVCV